MKYDYQMNIIRGHAKRMEDLAKRKSHSQHETQIAYANLLYAFMDLSLWRVWARIKSTLLILRMEDLHVDCCDINKSI